MQKCYLDSNFLIYLLNSDSPAYETAVGKINQAADNNTFCLSHLTLDEFLHSFPIELRQIRSEKEKSAQLGLALEKILLLPGMEILTAPTTISRQNEILLIMNTYNLRPRDAYHLWIMQSNNVKMFGTFDHDFAKVFAEKIVKKL